MLATIHRRFKVGWLAACDPQASVQIDLAHHRVRIETAEDRETIESAVTEAGYTPG